MNQWLQDLRLGARGLRRSPAFAFAAIATLGIGLGAAIAVFAVIQGVLLRPLPYPDADRLVLVSVQRDQSGNSFSGMGTANARDLLGAVPALGDRFAFDGISGVASLPSGLSWRASGTLVSADFTKVLGVAPFRGRTFTREEVDRGQMLALISYGCWKDNFNGRPDIVGQPFLINGVPAEVVGVMPEHFFFDGSNAQFWIPWTTGRDWSSQQQDRGGGPWTVVARLAENASLELAQQQADVFAETLRTGFVANRGLDLRVMPYTLHFTGAAIRKALGILGISVAAVLLIACSNVGNLLLIRGIARSKELQVRAALGATRARIIRQLCTEGIALSVISTAVGLLIAYGAVALIRRYGPDRVPRLDEISLDGWSLAFAGVLAALCSVLFGVIPALRVNDGADAAAALRSGRGETSSRAAGRARSLLVIAQFALAVALLSSAAVLGRSFQRILQVDPGFRSEQVIVGAMTIPAARSDDARLRYLEQVLERVAAFPGVSSAAVVENLLLNDRAGSVMSVETVPAIGPEPLRVPTRVEAVSGSFFEVLGVPLKAGRFFDGRDAPQSPRVAIINDKLAEQLWPGEDSIGRKLRAGPSGDWLTIVGVVGSMRRQALEMPPLSEIFVPHAQSPFRNVTLIARTSQDLVGVAPALRKTLVEVDPGVPVETVRPLSEELKERLAVREFNLGLMMSFTLVALVLAGVGIYGTTNYAVLQRRKEIGIRMALGAEPRSMVKMVLRQGLTLALVGMALGTMLAAAVTSGLGSMLYAVGPLDFVSFAGANAVLLVIAAIACLVPARFASAVDPSVVLRSE